MDNMIFTSEVCGVVLIAPFDKISRPPCSTIRFIVFLSLFFRCFSPFSLYHRTFSLTTAKTIANKMQLPDGAQSGGDTYHFCNEYRQGAENICSLSAKKDCSHKRA